VSAPRGGASRFAAALLGAVLLGACGGDGRTVLTVYSPHGSDLLGYFETEFEKANPTADVQWVDMGSQEVLERLRAEKANPQADVWFGAPAESFERAAKDGLLVAYRPSWADAVPDEARDPRDLWYGTYMTPEVIGYNSEVVSEAEAPKDWDDVLDPKWRDKVLIRDPLASGTMRAIFGAMIARAIDSTGSPEAGYDWLLRLDANTKEYTFNPTILYDKLARREGLITLYNMPDIATLQSRRGVAVKYVVPASGTPILVDAIALVQGSEQPDLAKRYYEFVTSREAMIEAAERFIRIPTRTDIPDDSLPPIVREARRSIKPMRVDRALIAEHLDEWMRYWDANIRNRGRAR
jgi:iron(III) transport system substrate-binding protein